MKAKTIPVWPALAHAGLLVLLGLALAGCSQSGANPQMPPPPQVNVSAVVQKDVVLWDEFTGRVEAVDKVEVRPRVAGYLEKVNFDEGRDVKKGDVLFEIDAREYRAAHSRALAEVDRARSRVALALRQLERSQQLVNSKLGARTSWPRPRPISRPVRLRPSRPSSTSTSPASLRPSTAASAARW